MGSESSVNYKLYCVNCALTDFGREIHYMALLQTRLETFYESKDASIMYITGETGCGKTRGVMKYVHQHFDQKNCLFLFPHRKQFLSIEPSLYVKVMTLQKFCEMMMYSSLSNQIVDLVVMDEFHVESTEWLITLCLFQKYSKLFPKIIFISATFSSYHLTTIETYLQVKHSNFHYFELTSPLSYNVDIEYIDQCYLKDTNFEYKWTFNRYTFPSQETLSLLLINFLKTLETTSSKVRILVFLQSPNICEQVLDVLKKRQIHRNVHECWKFHTIHGQSSKQETTTVLQSLQNHQVILGTNVLETSITIPNLTHVFDFAMCFAKTDHSNLELRYCSQSEMIQRAGRTGRTCNGKVFRFVSKSFYETREYSISHHYDWSTWVLRHCLRRQESSLESLQDLFSSSRQDQERKMTHITDIHEAIRKMISWGILDTNGDCVYNDDKKQILQQMNQSNCPFQIRLYKPLVQLVDKWKRGYLSNKYFILSTGVMALLDTFERYTFRKFFYFPPTLSFDYLSCWNQWKEFLHTYTTRVGYFEQVLTVVFSLIGDLCHAKHSKTSVVKQWMNMYQINGRMFRQFCIRWKSIISHFFPKSSTNFLVYISSFFHKNDFYKDDWYIPKETRIWHVIVEMKKDHLDTREDGINGHFHLLRFDYWDHLFTLFWNLDTCGLWNTCIQDSSNIDSSFVPSIFCKNFLSECMYLYLSPPRHVETFYRTKKDMIQKSFVFLQDEQHFKQYWKMMFTKNVIECIDTDVAYRPPATPSRHGMKKYIETLNHFDDLRSFL